MLTRKMQQYTQVEKERKRERVCECVCERERVCVSVCNARMCVRLQFKWQSSSQ